MSEKTHKSFKTDLMVSLFMYQFFFVSRSAGIMTLVIPNPLRAFFCASVRTIQLYYYYPLLICFDA